MSQEQSSATNRIPDRVLESIKRNTSILSLLHSYRITPVKRGNGLFATCPFHQVEGKPESTPSLSIDTINNQYHCFSCNASGDVIKLVMDYNNVNFLRAVEILLALQPSSAASRDKRKMAAKEENGEEQQKPTLSEEERQTILREIVTRSTQAFRNSKDARLYLEQRGLDPLTLLQSYTIGYWSPEFHKNLAAEEKKKLSVLGLATNGSALFDNCTIFPLCKDGRITTIYGRNITTSTDSPAGRHYMMPGTRAGLYLPTAGLNPRSPVVITESIIDALSLFTAGITNVLPLLGVNGFLKDHLDYLKSQAFPKIFIALNGDTAGNRAAAQLQSNLNQQGLSSEIITLPEDKDINDMLLEMGPGKLKVWFLDKTGEQQPGNSSPTVWEDGSDIWVLINSHEYRVRNLSTTGMDRLKVNLLVRDVNAKHSFHVDTLDLYQARSREHFVNASMRLFSAERDPLNTEMNQLITTLEEVRLRMKDGNDPNKEYQMSEQERAEAMEYLKSPNLLGRIAADFEACGIVGNTEVLLISYLGALSRLTNNPFGILLIALSGAGKSAVQNIIAKMTPEESLLAMSRLTSQTLFYQPKDGLKHKFINIEEDEGAKDAFFALRVLLSSQKLSVHSLKTDAKTGEYRSYENKVEGPASVMISTTDLAAFDHETANRFFMLYLDSSTEQTKRILAYQRRVLGEDRIKISVERERICKLHRNIQRLLKPIQVLNKIGNGIEYPAEIINTRRENTKADSLLETIALLHQYQREIKTEVLYGIETQYIEVKPEDVSTMHRIAGNVLRQSLSTEMSKLCRDLLFIIHKLIGEKYEESKAMQEGLQRWQLTFTRKELMDRSRWSMWHIREHLDELVQLGYITPRTGKKGQRFAYSLVEENYPELPELLKSK